MCTEMKLTYITIGTTIYVFVMFRWTLIQTEKLYNLSISPFLNCIYLFVSSVHDALYYTVYTLTICDFHLTLQRNHVCVIN